MWALDIQFPRYYGDFMPYVQLESGTYDHWVGYYSSTPVLKKMIRDLFHSVWSLKSIIFTELVREVQRGGIDLQRSLNQTINKIRGIEEDTSIMLHHDAITSTSPVGTLDDYMRWIWDA